MKKSKHIKKRMSQRGINDMVVYEALEHGRVLPNNKRVLDRKAIESRLFVIDNEKQVLLDAHRKGGVVVVLIGDTLVTTYGLGLER